MQVKKSLVYKNKFVQMAINKNHEFEELDGVKCGIVEKNVLPQRVDFVKKLLEYNGFTVVIVPSPPSRRLSLSAKCAWPAAICSAPTSCSVASSR